MRVVSLLPSGTEIVAALGALDCIVGITHECDHPPEVARVQRVTSSAVERDAASAEIDGAVRELSASGSPVFTLYTDAIVRLAPDVILTQTLCDVCAVSEGDVRIVSEAMERPPRILSLVGTTLDAVWEDVRAVGAAIGRSAEAEALLGQIAARMRRVHETLKAAKAPRPRVAVIEWMEPLYLAGHWTPELVRRAGGIDVLAQPGDHSVSIPLEQVREAEPELLLFAPCGFDLARSEREARALLATPEWEWARGRQAWAIDGNALTSRPGPRLADAVEVIAAIIAPTLFDTPAGIYARRVA
jgi:iron complex transport system substrate-binding protein